MNNLIDAIVRYRQQEGISRGELAKRLGVATSTVSSWERGEREPRPQNLVRLHQLIGYRRDVQVEQKAEMNKPVQPRLRTLPFNGLSPSDFERFFEDFLRYKYPKAKVVSRLGSNGHRQYGMDVIVIEDGKIVLGVQCKQVKTFGVAKAKEVIKKVASERLADHLSDADKVLALSLESCSPDLTLLTLEEPSWSIWDGGYLSAEVRQLPMHQAVRLIDCYFPEYRFGFLGVREPSVWESPASAFESPFNGAFNHEWALVGLEKQLQQIRKQVEKQGASLSIISGQGGMGKTRLLKEVSDQTARSAEVFVLTKTQSINPSQFELIPPVIPIVVIIDDAHKDFDLSYVLKSVWRRNGNASIVIGLREFALEEVLSELVRENAEPENVCHVELKGLSTSAAVELSRQVLGNSINDYDILYFASRTKDCPLAIVLGGHLIKNRGLSVTDFSVDAELRRSVLSAYVDFHSSNIPSLDSRAAKDFLEALALVQPFDVSSEEQRAVLQSLVELDRKELFEILQLLCGIGLVQRRGDSHRIVPDLVGEILLSEASFNSFLKASTFFLEENFENLSGQAFMNAFINANQIEFHSATMCPGSLPDNEPLWRLFREKCQLADSRHRSELFALLKNVAEYQPERVLETIEWGLDNPVDGYSEDNKIWATIYPTGEAMVLQEMVPALRVTAHSLRYVDSALRLLLRIWKREAELKGHNRKLAQAAIEEIVGFGVGKNSSFNDRALQTILEFDDFDLSRKRYSFLTPLLEIECISSIADDQGIRFQSYPIRADVAEPLRQKVLEAALRDFSHHDLEVSGGAFPFIEASLQRPKARFGRALTSEESQLWEKRAVGLLEELGNRLKIDSKSSIKAVGALKISNHLRHLEGLELVGSARALYGWAYSKEDVKRFMVWFPGGMLSLLPYGPLSERPTYQVELVSCVKNSYSDLEPTAILEDLCRRIKETEEFFGLNADGTQFIREIAKGAPDVGVLICQDFVENRSKSLFSKVMVSSALLGLAERDWTLAEEWIGKLWDLHSCDREIIEMLSSLEIGELNVASVIELLEYASASEDARVRAAVCSTAVRLFDAGERENALKIVCSVEIGGSLSTADAVYFFYNAIRSGEPFYAFVEMLEVRKSELLELSTLGGVAFEYWFSKGLERGSTIVYEFLISRIKRQLSENSFSGPALSAILSRCAGMPRDSNFSTKLLELAKWLSELEPGEMAGTDLVQFVSAVVGSWDAEVLQYVDAQIRLGHEYAFFLLFAAPTSVAWKQPESTVRLLRCSEEIGQEYLRSVQEALRINILPEAKVGTPGEPFPETCEQISRCKQIAENYRAFESIEKFYTELAEMGEREAQRERAQELRNDGRRW